MRSVLGCVYGRHRGTVRSCAAVAPKMFGCNSRQHPGLFGPLPVCPPGDRAGTARGAK